MSREPEDFFHSRLSLSPDGRHLLSVGWFWQPFGMAMVYDTALALTDESGFVVGVPAQWAVGYAAAADDGGAGLAGGVDHRGDPVALPEGDQGAHVGGRVVDRVDAILGGDPRLSDAEVERHTMRSAAEPIEMIAERKKKNARESDAE